MVIIVDGARAGDVFSLEDRNNGEKTKNVVIWNATYTPARVFQNVFNLNFNIVFHLNL